MSFIAELISLTLYPKKENVMVFGIFNQDGNIIKVTYKGNSDDIRELVNHKGQFRLYTNTAPIESKYKEKTVPMFQVYSFDTISTELDSMYEKPVFNVKFDA